MTMLCTPHNTTLDFECSAFETVLTPELNSDRSDILPGRPLAHLTTLTSCRSPSSLRLVSRVAAESGWPWSCPALTTSGSMASRMLRKASWEWKLRLDLGDKLYWISSVEPCTPPPPSPPSSSGLFCWPIFFSFRAAQTDKKEEDEIK